MKTRFVSLAAGALFISGAAFAHTGSGAWTCVSDCATWETHSVRVVTGGVRGSHTKFVNKKFMDTRTVMGMGSSADEAMTRMADKCGADGFLFVGKKSFSGKLIQANTENACDMM